MKLIVRCPSCQRTFPIRLLRTRTWKSGATIQRLCPHCNSVVTVSEDKGVSQ